MTTVTVATPPQTNPPGYTRDQLSLIRSTVAKGATDDELRLFLYRCQEMGINPLIPGQIHFVKYGQGPGSIVVGIDGMRAMANRTGKLTGIKRGVVRSENGSCVGAWAEVYRTDWKEPAREEVSLEEYSTGKGPWEKMPETMIKKVAEAAALRMAFPNEMKGAYSKEEMDQANSKPPSDKQIARMFAIATKEARMTTEELKLLLIERYNIDTTSKLTLPQYEEICTELERIARGFKPTAPLPKPITLMEAIKRETPEDDVDWGVAPHRGGIEAGSLTKEMPK